jgi:hypothetical protein
VADPGSSDGATQTPGASIARGAVALLAGIILSRLALLLTGAAVVLFVHPSTGGGSAVRIATWAIFNIAVCALLGNAAGRRHRVPASFVALPLLLFVVNGVLAVAGAFSADAGTPVGLPDVLGCAALVAAFVLARRLTPVAASV